MRVIAYLLLEDPGHRERQTVNREASDGTANANFAITCRCLYVHCPGPKNFAREHCAFLLVDENREEKREEDKDTWEKREFPPCAKKCKISRARARIKFA